MSSSKDNTEKPPPPYEAVVPVKVDEEGTSKVPENDESNPPPKVKLFGLFRYADALDWIVMVGGILLSLGQGAALPAALLLYAKILNALMVWQFKHPADQNVTLTFNGTELDRLRYYEDLNTEGSLFDIVAPYCGWYALIGLAMWIAGSLHAIMLTVSGQRQLHRVRTRLFRAMLSKDAGWFDSKRTGALNHVLFEQVRKMEDGMCANLSHTTCWLGTAVSGFIIAFYSDWLVTIVIFSLVPLIFVISFIMIKIVRVYTVKQSEAYAKAGTIASEVISNIRTVLAFNKQEYEVNRYKSHLADSRQTGIIKTIAGGTAQGLAYFIMYSAAGLAFWWGNDPRNSQAGGVIMQILFCIMIATSALAQASPNFEVIGSALAAAAEVFFIIDQASRIDNFSEEGRKPNGIVGNIGFKNVAFSYPSRPDRTILKSLDLEIKRSQTVALVGPSGCGKSTTVQMLLRFYDAIAGQVTLDGVDIHELNVRWLRRNIGLVSQEPVLFNTTIRENIRLGAIDQDAVPDEQIVEAAKLSNAHHFISALPNGYDTMVGERGAQLSGGQKQRIAIARALVSNPRILVLDEATSALDTASEKVVQEALDKARIGRTTLVIAHRLSTIRNADMIAVIDGGVVAELGDHETLIQRGGLYYRLVNSQEVEPKDDAQSLFDEQLDVDNVEAAVVEQLIEGDDEIKHHHHATGSKRNSKRRGVAVAHRPKNELEMEQGGKAKTETKSEPKEPSNFQLMGVVLGWGRPELKLTILACIIAVVGGGIQPAYAVIISEFMGSFGPGDTQDKFEMLIGITVGLGFLHAVLSALEHWLFALIGERLTERMRCRVLGKILRMDAAWLDRQENQPSVLTTTLATDCLDIQGICGIRVALSLVAVVILGTAVIYSLIIDYRIALALLSIFPFIVISTVMYVRLIMQGNEHDSGANKELAVVAMDALSNMRTVMSLGAENFFLNRFSVQFETVKRGAIKKGSAGGPLMAFPFSSILFAGAITFLLGSHLMEQRETTFPDLIRIYTLIIVCGMAIGRQNSAVPTEDNARKSTKKLMNILNQEITVDKEDENGDSIAAKDLENRKALLSKPAMGRIEFKNVSFSYPSRPGIPVLKGVSFTVEPGQRVALCGPSGGGKSTIMQLVQRLYDPEDGEILIDGVDIRQTNIRLVRSNIGLVSQEPILFALSINENIAYGSKTPYERPTKEQIDKVCQQANVHGFLQKLSEGLDTQVGERGGQLSGGQKQRIAIARALVRNPAILLLDEATSALDTESEKVVQEALDAAAQGRTSLTIAHRLSTIQHSDKILVLEHGRVAEQGTHAELLALKGTYYNLQQAQNKHH